ncbi:MAG TPA: hypothetical protein VJW23_16785, partial [Propionibacteriaceae bacterium]|nr:hypothetical protein [Propionibacteriaceae bacterium]
RSADDAAASRLGGDVLHPAVGLIVLIVITVLNVHKPRGLTPYGQHKQTKKPKGSTKGRAAATPPDSRPKDPSTRGLQRAESTDPTSSASLTP